MRLSVVLATYNEAENIGKCINSVRGWCDEIIVVDGSSTDQTVNIAKSLGAKVFITTNKTMFHINKQIAIDKAQGEWILQLDADERVSQLLQKEIDQAILKHDTNGYWIPRKNYFLGRFLTKGGVYPDYTLRLYRKGKGKLPQKDVHEQAVVNGKTEKLSQPLLHLADPNLNRYFLRFSRYTNLLKDEYRYKKLPINIITFINYVFIKPIYWFLNTFIRHKGFMDSWQGFLFSFFSSLRFPVSYIKYLKNKI